MPWFRIESNVIKIDNVQGQTVKRGIQLLHREKWSVHVFLS